MNDNHESENHFYKGLFYGVVLGVGLVWFLGTKEGQKVKEEFLERGKNLLDKAQETLEAEVIEKTEHPKKKI